MSNNTVYLAGGIAGMHGAAAINWRLRAKELLEEYENAGFYINVLDPMRAKRTKLGAVQISHSFYSYKHLGQFFTSRGIMARDFNDVKHADVLLVNLLGAATVSIGSVVEMAWAYSLQKPVVVVMEELNNVHDSHPMLHECMSFRYDNLADGVEAVATILGYDKRG